MTTTVTTTGTGSNVQRLTEDIRDWRSGDLLVDKTRRIVRNVALTGLKSKNGYRYSESALRSAVPLYENKPVFLDHAANLSRPYDRSTRDLVGSIVNPRFEKDRLRGDVETLDTDAGRTFLALAEGESPAVGMSHVVLAERGAGGSVVEKIHDVVSVDAVAFPATTATLRESDTAPACTQPVSSTSRPWPGSVEALLSLIDVELPGHAGRLAAARSAPAGCVRRAGVFPGRVIVEVRDREEAKPRYYAVRWTAERGGVRLIGEPEACDPAEFESCDVHSESAAVVLAAAAAGRSELADGQPADTAPVGPQPASPEAVNERLAVIQAERDAAIAERDELQREIERLQADLCAAEHERAVDRLLADSQLPGYAVTGLLRQQLLAAADDAARLALISERRDLLKRLAVHPPSSRERLDTGPEVNDAAIVAAVRRRRFGEW